MLTFSAFHTQVFKFSGQNFSQLLELGQRFKPGKGDDHFCKPTDVAVAKDGSFFVADGYVACVKQHFLKFRRKYFQVF